MRPHSTELSIARFWSKVDKSGPCWLWQGKPGDQGYGEVRIEGKRWLTHRLAWTLLRGPIPEGMCLLHSCDVGYPVRDITYRLCCNPDDMFLGTRADNAADRDRKGRCIWDRPVRGDLHYHRLHPETIRRGEASPRATITAATVREVRLLHASGAFTRQQIAAQCGITLANAYAICARKSWKHVD